MTILPTHTCFDDALDYIGEVVKTDPDWAIDRLTLVHAICLAPAGPTKDRPFAHAWVEEKRDDCTTAVIQSGLLEGDKIYYVWSPEQLAEVLRPQDVTRYTVEQAWRENERTCHYGPWKPDYAALCGGGHTFEDAAAS